MKPEDVLPKSARGYAKLSDAAEEELEALISFCNFPDDYPVLDTNIRLCLFVTFMKALELQQPGKKAELKVITNYHSSD